MGDIWFCSADFLQGNNFYLYVISGEFDDVTLMAQFEKPHSGGNGPMYFEDALSLLYGESPYGGDGYFHRLNIQTSAVNPNAMTFAGGLAAAERGYNDEVYVTTGAGGKVFRLDGADREEVASLSNGMQAQGLAFLGSQFVLTEMDELGAVSFHRLWHPDPESIGEPVEEPDSDGGSGGGGGGCALGAGAPGLEWLLLLAGALFPLIRRRRN